MFALLPLNKMKAVAEFFSHAQGTSFWKYIGPWQSSQSKFVGGANPSMPHGAWITAWLDAVAAWLFFIGGDMDDDLKAQLEELGPCLFCGRAHILYTASGLHIITEDGQLAIIRGGAACNARHLPSFSGARGRVGGARGRGARGRCAG